MKRCARTILIFLLLGAVVTALISVLTALLTPTMEVASRTVLCRTPWEDWSAMAGDLILTERVFGLADSGKAVRLFHDPTSPEGASGKSVREPPWWSLLRNVDLARPNPIDEPDWLWFEEAAGWPIVAFASAQIADAAMPRSCDVLYGIDFGRPPLPSGYRRLVPTRPLWRGLAIDSLFYATILWLLLLAGPRMVRRHRRRKRGLCLKCAYDLRGDLVGGCPECGWNREESKA